MEPSNSPMESLAKTEVHFYSTGIHFLSYSYFIGSAHMSEESDNLSSSEDEGNPTSSSIQKDRSPASDIIKKFPPPNPLPPKSLLYSNEPLRIGGNIYFLYLLNQAKPLIENYKKLMHPKSLSPQSPISLDQRPHPHQAHFQVLKQAQFL